MMKNKQAGDAATVFLLALAAVSCDQNSQARAGHAEEKAKAELNQVGSEARQEAHRLNQDLAKGMNGTPTPSSEGAERKLAKAGQTVSEAARTAQVKAKLASELGLTAASNIRVTCRAGVVTLGGTATDAAEKRTAAAIAQQVDGVAHVNNEIRLQP